MDNCLVKIRIKLNSASAKTFRSVGNIIAWCYTRENRAFWKYNRTPGAGNRVIVV